MKTFFLSVSALALSASLAAAADLPVRNVPVRQPVPVPIFTWSGFYIGAQAGGGWQRDRFSETTICPTVCAGATTSTVTVSNTSTGSGAIGGGFVGFNWQFNTIVVGLEADVTAGSMKHKGYVPESEPDTFGSRLMWETTLRARLGYALDRALFYVAGGVAHGEIKHTYERFDLNGAGGYDLTASQSFTNRRTGWTLGAGVEYAFMPGWSTRFEYRYTDYGSSTNNPTIYTSPPTYVSKHRDAYHSLRAGVAFRF